MLLLLLLFSSLYSAVPSLSFRPILISSRSSRGKSTSGKFLCQSMKGGAVGLPLLLSLLLVFVSRIIIITTSMIVISRMSRSMTVNMSLIIMNTIIIILMIIILLLLRCCCCR